MQRILFLIALSLLLSGAGYSSKLPELNNTAQPLPSLPVPEIPYRKDTILPLAPKAVPDYYSGKLKKKGKYAKYLKDIKDFIPILESLKSIIENRNEKSLQFFSAKVNLINAYVNYLNKKYKNKPERNFESYKQILIIEKLLTETNEYWIYAAKYNKYLRGSEKDIRKDNMIIKQKLSKALISINKVIDILKSNFED